MKEEILVPRPPGVDWLLDCDPRPAQIEALARSYTGIAYRDDRYSHAVADPLAHAGRPAAGWGHFMEMRVGKTPTLLAEFLLFERDYGVNKGLVFTPNKYKHTWALEAEKFGIVSPMHVFESKKRAEFDNFMMNNNSGLVFVNYEALTYPENLELFAKWVDNKTYMGADESVIIKNPNSGFFKQAHLLSKAAAVTRPMTGKPTPQGVSDIYSQLRFARHLDGWNFYAFRNRFAKMGGFKNKKVIGVKNEDMLQSILKQGVFAARRVDWGTKIDCDYEPVAVPMLPRQKRAYDEMEKEFMAWLDNGEAITVDQVITKHVKLQQISSGWIYDEHKRVQELVPFHKTPKFIELKDRLENSISCKIIIIAHFVPTSNMLFEALEKMGLNPAVIRGDVHMKKMGRTADEEKRRFNEDPKCRVMIGQSKAIKYGHTLMGSQSDPCLAMAYYENSYSLDDRSQSEERPQGEGQQDVIHVMDFFGSPVEKKVIGALQRKETIASIIMGYYKGER